MAIQELYSGTRTTSPVEGSETVLNTNSPETTDAIIQVILDLNALANGDELLVRIKEKVISAGTQRAVTFRINDAQGADQHLWISPAFQVMHGWDVTLQQTAGSSIAIPWSIRAVT